MSNSSICFMYRTLSDATISGQSGPGNDGNEGVFQHYLSLIIRLFNVISRTLVGRRSYSSAGIQSMFSMAPTDWAQAVGGTYHSW